MKAIYKYTDEMLRAAKVVVPQESEEDWTQSAGQKMDDARIRILWYSEAPGSGAPASVLAGAVQATYNLGYDAGAAEKLFFEGLAYLDRPGMLKRYTAAVYHALNTARRNPESDYWRYGLYTDWAAYLSGLSREVTGAQMKAEKSLPAPQLSEAHLWRKLHMGWMGQICAGAFGTALEGYHRDRIRERFNVPRGYVKPPATYNDDITFELALLKAFETHGKETCSEDIAMEWVQRIPYGWSAEDIALKNIMCGIMPPESGRRGNPYREWIGAQMRGAVCGMLAPGDPLEAARLAWMDGEISHTTNGILGEVFNAVLTALALVSPMTQKSSDDAGGQAPEGATMKALITEAMRYIPADSLYYHVVHTAYTLCETLGTADAALKALETQFGQYNLVHALPNAAIEVVALYFGAGDYDETLAIVGAAGLDVDCNAAQVGTLLGILNWEKGLSAQWTDPIGTTLKTYVRGMETLEIKALVDLTYSVYRKLKA